jgi:hypothetical protein
MHALLWGVDVFDPMALRSLQGRATMALASKTDISVDIIDCILSRLSIMHVKQSTLARFFKENPARKTPMIKRMQGRAAVAMVGACHAISSIPLDIVDVILRYVRDAPVPLRTVGEYNRVMRRRVGDCPYVMN